VLRLLLDTSVWINIAKSRSGQRRVVSLRTLQLQDRLELLVPTVVVDEFERNRPRTDQAVTTAVLDRLRQARMDLHENGGNTRSSWLDDLTPQPPLVSSATLRNFSDISDLLRDGTRLEPSEEEFEAVVRRGLAKRAPFHHKTNASADALIIELYGAAVRDPEHRDDVHCLATSNHLDFSASEGDRREPHPDLADFFAEPRSEYAYGVEALEEVLIRHVGADFMEYADVTEGAPEEPRTLAEILAAQRELVGRARFLGDGSDEWAAGFVDGQLSALRWVLGSDWDPPDTTRHAPRS
jgi:PIN domain